MVTSAGASQGPSSTPCTNLCGQPGLVRERGEGLTSPTASAVEHTRVGSRCQRCWPWTYRGGKCAGSNPTTPLGRYKGVVRWSQPGTKKPPWTGIWEGCAHRQPRWPWGTSWWVQGVNDVGRGHTGGGGKLEAVTLQPPKAGINASSAGASQGPSKHPRGPTAGASQGWSGILATASRTGHCYVANRVGRRGVPVWP